MTHSKSSFILFVFTVFLTVNAHTQVSLNIDSVRQSLSASQQNYKTKQPLNPFSSTPVSCVFATNSFKENAQITRNTAISPVDADKALFKNDKNPVQNTYILRDPFEIITDKNATAVERIVGALLLFSYL
jgi:hypothetical protein